MGDGGILLACGLTLAACAGFGLWSLYRGLERWLLRHEREHRW